MKLPFLQFNLYIIKIRCQGAGRVYIRHLPVHNILDKVQLVTHQSNETTVTRRKYSAKVTWMSLQFFVHITGITSYCLGGKQFAKDPCQCNMYWNKCILWDTKAPGKKYSVIVADSFSQFNFVPIYCWRSSDNPSVRSSVPVVSKWLWPGNRTFSEVASMVGTWWILAFFAQWHIHNSILAHPHALIRSFCQG